MCFETRRRRYIQVLISMALSTMGCSLAGIVGLPNVGSLHTLSTPFNVKDQRNAQAAENYPLLHDLSPKVGGDVAVAGARLDVIAEIGGSATRIPARMISFDMLGLVKRRGQGRRHGQPGPRQYREPTRSSMFCAVFEMECHPCRWPHRPDGRLRND